MLVAVFPDYPGAALSGKQRATISAEVVQLALGAGLVLGIRGLAALVHRLRYGKTGDLPQRGDTQGEMRDV